MNKDLSKLEPQKVIKNFLEISKYPRGSGNEKAVMDFLLSFFKKCGAEVHMDKNMNLIARKKATKGYEKLPIAILQAHSDMVNVKTDDSDHDFNKDGIEVYEENGYIKANKTSLGADNGLGLAMIMTIFEDDSISHGPIEALITVDEEPGLLGVAKMENNQLKGDYLISVDGSNDEEVVLGSLGGGVFDASINLQRESLEEYETLEITISNGVSGHSGHCIIFRRINAIKQLFTLTYKMSKLVDLRLIEINGGLYSNAICGNATIKLAIKKTQFEMAKKIANDELEALKNEYKLEETNLSFNVEKSSSKFGPIVKETSQKIINAITSVYNGLRIFDFDYKIAHASSNLGVAITSENEMIFKFYSRSPVIRQVEQIMDEIEAALLPNGFKINLITKFAGWSPDFKNNDLANKIMKIYNEKFNSKMTPVVCGGGIEVAIILDKNRNIKNAISIGATNLEEHSVNENVSLKSIQKVFDLLKELLIIL